MKNSYKNSQNDTNRYPEDNRYGRSNFQYDDENDNYEDNRYYSGQYNNDYNQPNYNYPQSNVNNYTGYSNPSFNNPQPYRKDFRNDYQAGSSNRGQNDDWNNSGRNKNYENYNSRNDYGYNSPNHYHNQQDRNWWDRTRDEVSSWFGDDDAERRRGMDEVRDQNHRGKGPKNYTRSSDRIREDVNDKLSDAWMLDASEIEVDVKGNEITLNGTVDSKSAKRRSEDIADSVSGVAHVQNNLRVKKADDVTSKDTNGYTARSRKEVANHN